MTPDEERTLDAMRAPYIDTVIITVNRNHGDEGDGKFSAITTMVVRDAASDNVLRMTEGAKGFDSVTDVLSSLVREVFLAL